MKIKITKKPEITYSKVIYVFNIKIKNKEYKVCRHEDDNGAELYVTPHPQEDGVYDAIEDLFFHDDFDYNTVQVGEEIYTHEDDEL